MGSGKPALMKGRFFALAANILRMRFSPCLVILILAGSAVFAAGCTQGMGPVQPATPVPVGIPDLHDLALNPSELPACFSLADQHPKSPGEVGQLAKDLGWQAGYVVTYTCPAEGPESTVIVHSLAVYPAVNTPGIASMVDAQDRSAGFTYEDLPFPNQDFPIRGFYGTAREAQVSGIPPGIYVVSGGRELPEMSALSGSNVAEIIFYRGPFFEVLKMTGPGTNVTVLRELAQKASAKIP
jgi:hypothetical protein